MPLSSWDGVSLLAMAVAISPIISVGAGAHHLSSQDLSGICVSDDLHETSLFLGDQGFAVSAGDVLADFHRVLQKPWASSSVMPTEAISGLV